MLIKKKNNDSLKNIVKNSSKKNKLENIRENFSKKKDLEFVNKKKIIPYDTKNKNRFRSKIQKKIKFKRNDRSIYSKKNKLEDNRSNNFKNKNKNNFFYRSSVLQQHFTLPKKNIVRNVYIRENITVSELAYKMSMKASELIKKLMNIGIMVTINQVLDQETAQLVTEEMGHKVFLLKENDLETSLMRDRELIKLYDFKARPPVVTVMGHVDHGKTSILDYIRSEKIAKFEVGGITQHIGAYNFLYKNESITFLDTPGHAAFSAMRSRGVKITDIVVLVVAADDGIMPQTIEAIQHAQSANVPIIVAINKVDKLDCDIDRIQQDLIKYSIISEKFGGNNITICVSAKTGFGIDNLLNSILLQSEILELKSFHKGMATGIVIESSLNKGFGPIATILVQEGNLKKGDIVICGCEYGKIKTLRNEFRINISSAGPSIPVEIVGLSGVPITGDILKVVKNEKKAREVALYRKEKNRTLKLTKNKNINVEILFKNSQNFSKKNINIILKTDVQGSLEAIYDSIAKISTNEIKIIILFSGVGSITESDVALGISSNAILIGFNVRADFSAKKIINEERLDVRYYSIIYNLIDDLKQMVQGLIKPKSTQKVIGLAEVRNIFKSPQFGVIAGCMVLEGMIQKTFPIRVLRNNIVIYEGELESLRRFKEDLNIVRHGTECGIGVKNYNDVKIGDIIEVFKIL